MYSLTWGNNLYLQNSSPQNSIFTTGFHLSKSNLQFRPQSLHHRALNGVYSPYLHSMLMHDLLVRHATVRWATMSLFIYTILYACMVHVHVCLWPATLVHLKLFSCRQARSARSRALHLVNLGLSRLLGRLGSCVCVRVCEKECVCFAQYPRAILCAFPATYAMLLNCISTYPLYTDTHSEA